MDRMNMMRRMATSMGSYVSPICMKQTIIVTDFKYYEIWCNIELES
jgi:hypothetical protein